MKGQGNSQKKVKIAIIVLILLALSIIVVSCMSAGFSRPPQMSDKNLIGTQDNITPQTQNVFSSFWTNLVSIVTGEQPEENNEISVNENNPGVTDVENQNSEDKEEEEVFNRKDGFYNFLLLAKDVEGLNTDVIMVLSFDTKNNKIAILQVPRDCYVNVPYNFNKINSVYAAGYNTAAREGKSKEERKNSGVHALEEALLTNLGIVIDRYALIDIAAFRYIVDAVDGVDVYIQEDMYYEDEYQDLVIHLPKGEHHLDGEKAEGFVRFRNGYINADLGRLDAQKIFMSAFLDKLFSVSSVAKIPELASETMKYLETNISLSDAVWFGKQFFEVDMSEITMHSVQGEALYYNGVAYFSLYEKANLELVNKHFNAFDREIKSEHIDMKMLAAEPANSTYNGGSSAKEINDENPHLQYIH